MIQVEYVNPFIQATVNLFKTMIHTEIERGQLFLKQPGSPKSDISGTIGIAGGISGVISLTFTKDTACYLASRMLGEDCLELNETVKDSIGEIANIVAGSTKAIMIEKGYHFKLALPSVIVGGDHSVTFPSCMTSVVVPFNIKENSKAFHLEVCIKLTED